MPLDKKDRIDLRKFSSKELLEELQLRGATGSLRYGCSCGSSRRVIVDRTKGFYPREGCLNCDRWDGPPILDGTPTV